MLRLVLVMGNRISLSELWGLLLCAVALAACTARENLGSRMDAGIGSDQGELTDLASDASGCGTCALNEACDTLQHVCVSCEEVLGGCQARNVPIAVGDAHACMARLDGFLYCWGDNARGQLGVSGSGSHPTPARVPDLERVIEVEAGAEHTCARSYGSSQISAVACFGRGLEGELGAGTAVSSAEPQFAHDTMGAIANASEISAGNRHTCMRLPDAIPICAGDNTDGQAGGFEDAPLFSLQPIARAVSIATGDAHTCAARPSGEVACWGKPADMRLGLDDFSPVAVPLVTRAIRVAAGDAHTCAMTLDGDVWCWGRNVEGQVSGDAVMLSPHLVAGLDGVVQIAAGRNHSCALRDNGTVWCWGDNTSGQLGVDPTTISASRTPISLPSLPIDGDVAQLVAGGNRVCALRNTTVPGQDADLYCWGEHIGFTPTLISFTE